MSKPRIFLLGIFTGLSPIPLAVALVRIQARIHRHRLRTP
jgi:hypothetical protein